MKDTILKIKGAIYERLMVTDSELYLAISTYKDKETIEKELSKGSKLTGIKRIALDSINKIDFGEAMSSVTVHYVNDNGKTKKQSLSFDKESQANDFGNFLGGELMFEREIKDEKRMLKLLGNILAVVVIVGILVSVFKESTYNSFLEMESSNGKSGRNTKLLQMVLGMAGHKPTLGILAVLALFTGKTAFDEFKKPAKVVTYSRA